MNTLVTEMLSTLYDEIKIKNRIICFLSALLVIAMTLLAYVGFNVITHKEHRERIEPTSHAAILNVCRSPQKYACKSKGKKRDTI